ncbi:MAG: glycosyltransferase family 39 protein [Acidobacteria bacterium]|nr:glycosyltransferase family 39 protein [Acidobacteriota bacterium]
MLSRRDVTVWIVAFLAVACWIVAIRFESADADSMLYAGLSARIAEQPWPRWIAPEWWGLWPRIGLTGYFREHPVGGFVLPALLARAGVPGEQAAYIVGVAAGLAVLLLIGHLVAGVTSRAEARASLVLLQCMPVAFVFRVRANQEYLLLACLLVIIVGLDRARASWKGVGLVVCGVCGALLVKGAFLVLVLAGAVLWLAANPRQAPGSSSRAVGSLAIALGAAAATAVGYEAFYRHVTGESFFATYWERQFSEVDVATPVNGAATFVQHVWFYIVRLLWHPAPWSLFFVAALWRHGVRGAADDDGPRARRALWFTAAYALALVVMLSPSSRVAERYVFYATYAVAAAGTVAAYRGAPRLRRTLDRLDASLPAFPALVWFALIAARLGLGPFLPRW